jgi:hypothetical protein
VWNLSKRMKSIARWSLFLLAVFCELISAVASAVRAAELMVVAICFMRCRSQEAPSLADRKPGIQVKPNLPSRNLTRPYSTVLSTWSQHGSRNPTMQKSQRSNSFKPQTKKQPKTQRADAGSHIHQNKSRNLKKHRQHTSLS